MVNLRNGLKSCTKNTETPSDYSIIIDDLPINLDEGNENVFERLKVIKFRTDAIRKLPDVWVRISLPRSWAIKKFVFTVKLSIVRLDEAVSERGVEEMFRSRQNHDGYEYNARA